MISNILPIVALAGVAAASCPLSVQITGTTNHVAQVSITNTGNETLTVFKGNTVLSEHATKDLLVADASMQFSFIPYSTSSQACDLTNTLDRWQSAPIRWYRR
jgi:deuterolysin